MVAHDSSPGLPPACAGTSCVSERCPRSCHTVTDNLCVSRYLTGAAAKVQLEGSTRPPWHTLAAVRTTTAGRSCRRVRLSLSAQHASDLNAYPNIQVGRACNALLALAVALACGFTQAFLPLSQHTGFGCARSPQPPHTATAPFKCRCPIQMPQHGDHPLTTMLTMVVSFLLLRSIIECNNSKLTTL